MTMAPYPFSQVPWTLARGLRPFYVKLSLRSSGYRWMIFGLWQRIPRPLLWISVPGSAEELMFLGTLSKLLPPMPGVNFLKLRQKSLKPIPRTSLQRTERSLSKTPLDDRSLSLRQWLRVSQNVGGTPLLVRGTTER